MDNVKSKKGWLWFGVGSVLQAINFIVVESTFFETGFFIEDLDFSALLSGDVIIRSIIYVIPVIFGLRLMAQARGRNVSWGWLGLLNLLIGPLNVISAVLIARLNDLTTAIWYYRQEEKDIGPLTLDAIAALIEQDTIENDTPVWSVDQKEKELTPASVALTQRLGTTPQSPPSLDHT